MYSIIIPDSVTLVGRGAFEECTSLSQISLSNGLKEIEDDTFRNCSSLTKIEIPSNVKLIWGMVYRIVDDEVGCFTSEAGAFLGCVSLKSVVLRGKETEVKERAFQGCTQLKEIIVPKGASLDKICNKINDNVFVEIKEQ